VACAITECTAPFDDCNGVVSDGCEAHLPDDPANCGTCDLECGAAEECVGGICESDVCLPSCDCDAICTTSDACNCVGGCLCDGMVCADNCSARCSGAATVCVIDATSVSNLTPFFCGDGATCYVDMSGSGGNLDSGERHCTGPGTSCDINCEDASNCHPYCLDHAECVLRCAGASNCSFEDCWTSEVSCPGDVEVCGRDCGSL
jgi:hypothetical protein